VCTDGQLDHRARVSRSATSLKDPRLAFGGFKVAVDE
jgi:hypothetical protein